MTTVKNYMHMNDTIIQDQKRKYSPGDHLPTRMPGPRGRSGAREAHPVHDAPSSYFEERMHKIRCELVVLRFVEDSHFFHECKQGDHLTSNKGVFDNCSHLFILDI